MLSNYHVLSIFKLKEIIDQTSNYLETRGLIIDFQDKSFKDSDFSYGFYLKENNKGQRLWFGLWSHVPGDYSPLVIMLDTIPSKEKLLTSEYVETIADDHKWYIKQLKPDDLDDSLDVDYLSEKLVKELKNLTTAST